MRTLINRGVKKLHRMVERRTDFDESARVTLLPDGVRKPERWALLSYVIEPFLLEPGEPVPNSHTNHWESLQMARTLLELGFGVDVISYRNTTFVPRKDYALFIGARTNFSRLASHLPPSCVKIAHLDTAHWLVNNANAYQRALAIKRRTHQVIDLPRKVVEPNWAIESADYATILGNEFTEQTYRYAGKPIFRLPLPSCQVFDCPHEKDFEACRKRFVWFGSDGLVHKGLDLALEAFAEMEDYELLVCGPIKDDTRFVQAYRRELYELPNITTVDWVDIASDKFREIVDSTLGLVYPSCSEGGGGSVITCMQAGLIPIVTREASVDIDPCFGVMLPDDSIECVRSLVRNLSARPAEELRAMALASWQTARNGYTRERYSKALRHVIEGILDRKRERAPISKLDALPKVAG
jgi:glycosyltransferase involved in cell wall biosynthesis